MTITITWIPIAIEPLASERLTQGRPDLPQSPPDGSSSLLIKTIHRIVRRDTCMGPPPSEHRAPVRCLTHMILQRCWTRNLVEWALQGMVIVLQGCLGKGGVLCYTIAQGYIVRASGRSGTELLDRGRSIFYLCSLAAGWGKRSLGGCLLSNFLLFLFPCCVFHCSLRYISNRLYTS